MSGFRRFAGISAAIVLGLAGAAYATVASADDIMVMKAPPVTPAVPPTCTSVPDFFLSSCILSWYGITVYGTIDAGVGWESHGTPFNSTVVTGDEYLLQKNSNRSLWLASPNGLSQSNIGIKGNEPIAPGWAFVFDLEAGFDPYSFQLATGPGAVYDNRGVPLTSQDSNADSSRAGQFYNSLGYFGFSSPSYGTLTILRQNALTLDGVLAYDPLGGSYAFSPIGFQGTTCGVGDTEDCRFSTALKYRVNIGPLRAAALWQFGGYDLNNASNGAWQGQLGGDIPNLGGGVLSVDAIGSYVRDAVAVADTGGYTAAGPNGYPLGPFLPQTFTATISDDTSVMALARYATGPLKLFGGFEWIQYAPPSDTSTSFTDIAGDCVALAGVGCLETNINNTAYDAGDKTLYVFWTGAKYAVTTKLDLMAGYYHYTQPAYQGAICSDTSKATCSGGFNAVSFAVDWRFAEKFDAYAGFMYSEVYGGYANGYLNRSNIDPTVGMRFRF